MRVAEITLAHVSFKVSEKRRQAVISNRCREVPAWAVGTVVAKAPVGELTAISYNPYRGKQFTTRDGSVVEHCET